MEGLMKARSCDSSCNPSRLTGKPVGLFGFLRRLLSIFSCAWELLV
jgi:hypothetical protein